MTSELQSTGLIHLTTKPFRATHANTHTHTRSWLNKHGNHHRLIILQRESQQNLKPCQNSYLGVRVSWLTGLCQVSTVLTGIKTFRRIINSSTTELTHTSPTFFSSYTIRLLNHSLVIKHNKGMSHCCLVVGYDMLSWLGNINAMIWSQCVFTLCVCVCVWEREREVGSWCYS